MAFGIYIHIPYCLQRCTFCDFATVPWGQSLPPRDYYELLVTELRSRRSFIPFDRVDSIYFGGGTPSLVGPEFIVSLIGEIENQGFARGPDTEITIEINPATVTSEQITDYRRGGVNRYSAGVQTFSEKILKPTGRLHSVQDSIETLKLLAESKANFTLDLLFALPHQTLQLLKGDLDRAMSFSPNHVSTYCLTLPDHHPMNRNRAPEEEQAQMFELIEAYLQEFGIDRYEISSFSKPGRESKHNLIYWTDQSYWGLGVSAHSYLPGDGEWGVRFWNSPSLTVYKNQIEQFAIDPALKSHPASQIEWLRLHESLTDFCHTSLRLMRGLDFGAVQRKFPKSAVDQVQLRLAELTGRQLLVQRGHHWQLTPQGRLLPNLVFSDLTFLKSEPLTSDFCCT